MQDLFNLIPETYFVRDLKHNTLNTIKLALLREATGNLIIRSNYADETITLRVGDKDLVEIPARKLKSREKLTGLKICRQFEVVDESLRYNVIKKPNQLANPNSILFGDSVTETGDSVGLQSRAIYDWAYSLRDVEEVTALMQHNALSEGGTMYNEEEGKLRQSLFQVQYVKPGTLFPHFIMVENVTPELFFHLISTVLFTNRYFAQSTTTGANVQNHLLGIGLGRFEAPINSYQIAQQWDGNDISPETVGKAIGSHMEAAYGEGYLTAAPLIEWVQSVWRDEAQLVAIYQQAQKDCVAYLKSIKVWKSK